MLTLGTAASTACEEDSLILPLRCRSPRPKSKSLRVDPPGRNATVRAVQLVALQQELATSRGQILGIDGSLY